MNTLKKCLPDAIVIVIFAVISFAYFFVPVSQGKILFRHDSQASVGLGQELTQYEQRTGEVTRWTNSVFSGMPTYQISPSYNSTDGLSAVMSAYHLWLPDYVWFIFAYLLGFYILLRAFNFRQSLAALGSIIWAFSSYFLIIIAAGHLWKVMALAYLPPMIGGVVLAYRGKYLWGFIVTAVFTAFEIKANHVQMTYYYLFIVLFMVIAYLVQAIREKRLQHFFKASGILIAAALIGIAINISNLYHTWEYQKESMRGKSELTKANSANQTSSGLDRDYITQWSYGIDETLTLLVPDAKGGASVPLSQNATAMAKANPEVENMLPQLYEAIPQYFGTQPGTSGPVYVGAFVLFLFVLGLFIVKTPIKWALLAATALSILLSWGHNFMGFTNFFLDYVPMYAKFRTVASILVIAEFTIPLLAALALKRIVDEPTVLTKNMKYVYASLALTAGVALAIALMPSMMGPFVSDQERQMLSGIQGMTPDVQNMMLSSIATMRGAMVSADAWRSIVIIIIGVAMLLLFKAQKIKAIYLIVGISALCLIDLWQVDKRYLNDEMFVPKSERDTPQQATATDLQILKDKSLSYRVLNFASGAFNENNTSYFHKSIGGYHPAKLRRYQEMIDKYIAPEMQTAMQAIANKGGVMSEVDGRKLFPILNMLNAKYFIVPLQGNATTSIQNPYAQGNGWFVDKLTYVADANAEYAGVGKIDVSHEAVADKKFEPILGQTQTNDSTARVVLTKYEPNNMTYTVSSTKGGVVVFSEVYYPGWTATIDGQPAELGRVNYILRALNVKAGKHEVVLDFHPTSISTTETIAYAALIVLLLAICVAIYSEKKKQKTTKE
ncbi:YfhO family protein [Prevotella pallens]|jgi:putative membrane protein|uniref:YfhO family protein n=1 Tax=Prevotella pallens TaxID=60133 RepID=UPI001CAF5A66|nr:YfhO family protein [Prevotella pallens]MBF1468254.1 YfhO family protein [Prevotella pallens]MBF1487162.1 YfhO family protein [Prevotella pallens]MBF1504029.1 YfhO family protein [Prevotella pallens]MBF1512320.1 YfhO family protein [Prevotella pallens]